MTWELGLLIKHLFYEFGFKRKLSGGNETATVRVSGYPLGFCSKILSPAFYCELFLFSFVADESKASSRHHVW